MRTVSVAEAKAHLSAVIDAARAGEDIVITRHGRPVARIVAERDQPSRDPAEVLVEQRAFLENQKPRRESAVDTVRGLRDDARY